MKDYHKLIQSGIIDFGNNCKRGGHLLSISQRTLYINHPSNIFIKPIIYKPDVTFTTKDRRKCIFQILDSQTKNKREIEADIFRAFLCDGVKALVFIVKTKPDCKMVQGIVSIIQGVLHDYGVEESSTPKAVTALIPESVKCPNRVFENFNKKYNIIDKPRLKKLV
jgi:hypothetical protein